MKHLQSQITGNEGEFRDVLFHPLSHRDRDNHSTHRWPSGLIGWPTDFDTNWFSLTGKYLHNYLKRNLFFIQCVLQCNTYTYTDTTHPSRRSTNPKYFSRTGAAHCRPLSKGCRSLPPADLPLKHLVLHEMEIANSDATDKHRGWRILQLFPNKIWGSFFHFLKKK